MYGLLRHPPSEYPLSYQLSSPPIISAFFFISLPHLPKQNLSQFIIRPKFSSIIVTHHPQPADQSTFVITFYIYLLFRHPPSGHPMSYQLSSPPIIISRHPHQQTLFQFISRLPFIPYRSSPHVTPISRLHHSVSPEHKSISPDPIILFNQSINHLTRPHQSV